MIKLKQVIQLQERALMKVFFVALAFLFACSEEEMLAPALPSTTSTISSGTTGTLADCGCTYTVPSNTYLVDGIALGIKPGNVICLKAGNVYKNIVFRNIKGTATAPVIIRNCGGTVTLDGTGKGCTMKTEYSQYFRITGGSGTMRGIRLLAGHEGLQLDKLSSNFEIDHLEILKTGFSGIMAKTDPTCDNATIRGSYTMRNALIHDNYIHDTGGEAMYIGHSFYLKGVNTACGVRYPHTIEGLKIYNNVIVNSGWEAIQVSSTPLGAEVYNNRIENYGVKNVQYQNNGVQFGEGGKAKFHGNLIKAGKGTALMIVGVAENFAHNNIIISAGMDGIFCDERTTLGAGFKFINNTIINPAKNGIALYSEKVSSNIVLNNIIVNPGSFSTYVYPRNGNDAYIYLLSKTMPAHLSGNLTTRNISDVKFANPSATNYALTSTSPAVNKGSSIAAYGITIDYALQPRLKGAAYDIGAYEY